MSKLTSASFVEQSVVRYRLIAAGVVGSFVSGMGFNLATGGGGGGGGGGGRGGGGRAETGGRRTGTSAPPMVATIGTKCMAG